MAKKEDIYDYEAMPERFQQQPEYTPPATSRMTVENIFSAAAPEPVYDEELQKRRARVAKLNAAGRGFSVLGDILSLGLGGRVARREPDKITPTMMQSYQDYIQRYGDKKDQFEYQKFKDELQKRMFQYQEQDKRRLEDKEEGRYREKLDTEAERYADTLADRERQRELQERQVQSQEAYREWQQEWAQKQPHVQGAIQSGLSKQAHDQRMEQDRQKQEAYDERMRLRTKIGGTNNNQLNIYDDYGSLAATIDTGEMARLSMIIANDPALDSVRDMYLLNLRLGQNLTTAQRQAVIGYYWDKSPKAMEFLGLQGYVPGTGGQGRATQRQAPGTSIYDFYTPGGQQEEEQEENNINSQYGF